MFKAAEELCAIIKNTGCVNQRDLAWIERALKMDILYNEMLNQSLDLEKSPEIDFHLQHSVFVKQKKDNVC